MATPSEVRHEFEDATTGDETQPEAGVTYAVISTFVDITDKEVVFTHRIREA